MTSEHYEWSVRLPCETHQRFVNEGHRVVCRNNHAYLRAGHHSVTKKIKTHSLYGICVDQRLSVAAILSTRIPRMAQCYTSGSDGKWPNGENVARI